MAFSSYLTDGSERFSLSDIPLSYFGWKFSLVKSSAMRKIY